MAMERLLRRMGFRPSPDQEPTQFPGLEQYPDALGYLEALGISSEELLTMYPNFGPFPNGFSAPIGHAFSYRGTPRPREQGGETFREDTVAFYTPTDIHTHMMTVYRSEQCYPLGSWRPVSAQKIQMDILPDASAILSLSSLSDHGKENTVALFLDTDGNTEFTTLAKREGAFLEIAMRFRNNKRIPQLLSRMEDQALAQEIHDYSEEVLYETWLLSLEDLSIPSTFLAKHIMSAPRETGISLKDML